MAGQSDNRAGGEAPTDPTAVLPSGASSAYFWTTTFPRLPKAQQLRVLDALPARQRRALEEAMGLRPLPIWRAFPGTPQEQAYHCPADELFFGGAAGGGKTFLLLGLALTAHRHSILFRREYPQFREIIEKLRALLGPNDRHGRFNVNDMLARLKDGRVIELGSVPHEWDRDKYQGRAHDLIGFDELSHFTRSQYRFLIGWNRTDDARQRCRVVATGNPPTTPEGRWVVEEWAPWLEARHPDPAEPGELRWYTVADEKLVWLRSPVPILHKGERLVPRSRTFIPARVQDNPVYMQTGYIAVLQGMPEPLRSQMLYGDFNAGMQDDPWQVIPTAWVQAAQARWRPDGKRGPLDALGVDVARGGDDKTVLVRRYGPWFAHLEKHPGKTTRDGPTVVGLIERALTENPQALVNLDVIGIGSSPFDFLKLSGRRLRVFPVNFALGIDATDQSGTLTFINVRAWAYWKLRELLDPASGYAVALPPDPELLADLTASRWERQVRGVRVEDKEEIRKRLGRSPDCADALVLSTVMPAESEDVPTRLAA